MYEKVHYRVLGKDDVEQFRNDVRTRVEAMTALLLTSSMSVTNYCVFEPNCNIL